MCSIFFHKTQCIALLHLLEKEVKNSYPLHSKEHNKEVNQEAVSNEQAL